MTLFKPYYLFLCRCCFLPAEGSSARLVLPGKKKNKPWHRSSLTKVRMYCLAKMCLMLMIKRWSSGAEFPLLRRPNQITAAAQLSITTHQSITQNWVFSFMPTCKRQILWPFYSCPSAGGVVDIFFFWLNFKTALMSFILAYSHWSHRAQHLETNKQVAAWWHQTMCFTSCRAAKHLKPQISKQNIFINPIWLDKTRYNTYICIDKYMYTYIYILKFSYKKRSTLCFIHICMYRYRKVSAVT